MSEEINRIILKGEKLSSLISSGAYPTSDHPHYFKERNDTINISNIEVENNLQIKAIGKLNSLFFSNCHFKDDVIVAIEFQEVELSFHDCTFDRSCIFNKSKKSSISFGNCRVENLTFNKGLFSRVLLSLYNSNLYINGGNYENLLIGHLDPGNSQLNDFVINFSKLEGNIHVLNSVISNFGIFGKLGEMAYLNVKNIYVHHFLVYELNVLGKLILSNIYARQEGGLQKTHVIRISDEMTESEIRKTQAHFSKSIFSIYNSILDKSRLDFIDLPQFNEVNIVDSDLTSVFFSNMIWPNKIVCFNPPGSEFYGDRFIVKRKMSNSNPIQVKEIYRQIKYSLSKQGDVVGEQHFHGLEMTAYNKFLSWKKDWGIKLVLKLSFCTSNYGQSIIRAIVCLFGGHIILFFIAIIINGLLPLHISFSNPTTEGFKVAFEKYFIYINPIRKMEASLSGYLIILDIAMRIWTSYMIYNIVRASRRFIK